MLVAGFNDDGRNWSSVTPSLAASTRVCWYSRFGTGDSDQPSKPQTFSSQARDLDALLRAAAEPGPYLVVGHSYGGAVAVTFASLFPESVRGLVLIDASPPGWDRRSALCPTTAPRPPVISTGAAMRSLTRPGTLSTSTVPPRSPAWPRSARWAHFPSPS